MLHEAEIGWTGKVTYSTELRVFFVIQQATQIINFLTLLFVDFVFSTSGGMLMDPFRPGGMGSTGGQGFGPPPHPGQLPRFVIMILDIRWHVHIHFFPETDFIYNGLHVVQKWTKQKNSRFLSTGYWILPSCDCKVRETIYGHQIWTCSLRNLTRWLNSLNRSTWTIFGREYFTSKIYWCNCNILGLTDTVASLANEARLLRFRLFFGHVLPKTKSVTPNFFFLPFWQK